MDKLKELLQDNLNIELCSAVLSNPRQKEAAEKIKVRPLLQKEKLLFQIETFRNHQAFHRNVEPEEACKLLQKAMENMRQMQIETRRYLYTVLVSKKGKVTIKKKALACERKEIDLSHNRKKHYILEEGVPVPFLLDLGVMTEEGKVVNSRFDKFRQINRFLEFIEDILPELDWSREVTIIDFGCGKSYLTFAMYYYLHECKGYDIRIIGLDLKKEVIAHCSQLGKKYGYEKLTFLEGDIAGYTGVEQVDMVVTLHACDTATDYALAKAVGWGAKVILSVPCCQHELNGQIQCDMLKPIFRYGVIKERMAALITDALRADLLEKNGYDTQILEFIDMDHTPKNLMIRAVRQSGMRPAAGVWNGEKDRALDQVMEFLQVNPTLKELL